jgi:hypothetical protein
MRRSIRRSTAALSHASSSATVALAAVTALLVAQHEHAAALPLAPPRAPLSSASSLAMAGAPAAPRREPLPAGWWATAAAAAAEQLPWRRRRGQDAPACDTVGDGDGAVAGDGMLANVVGREGRGRDESETDTTTAAASNVGAYVHDESISAELMEAAYGGTFSCDPGWTMITDVTWVCGEDGGVAMLSGQPCANGIPPEGGEQLFYIVFGSLCAVTYLICWLMGYEKVEKKEKLEDDGACPPPPPPPPPPPQDQRLRHQRCQPRLLVLAVPRDAAAAAAAAAAGTDLLLCSHCSACLRAMR